jgi:hypothetical protein
MIFPTHVTGLVTVARFKRPLVDDEYDIPALNR